MNSLFQQLNQSSLNVPYQQPPQNNLINLFKKIRTLNNPTEYLNNIPEIKNVVNLVNANGGNAKEVFYNLAQQKGVNPQDILDMFK